MPDDTKADAPTASSSALPAAKTGAIEICLSLGSNLGDRLEHLSEAKRRIAALPGVALLAQSAVYETEPVGVAPQYRHLRFLNAVIVIQSRRQPVELLREFRAFELQMGRAHGAPRNAPRPIDIDIIYAGTLTVAEPELVIPHPRWAERSFVVKPLAELRPKLRIPGTARTVRELLFSLPNAEKMVPFCRAW